MNRPVSPLLHDYKLSARPRAKKSAAIHWFAVGLGLPFIGLALLLILKNASGTSSVLDIVAEPPLIGVLGDELELIDLSHIARLPEINPEPLYDSISVKVRPGDTMERIFRKNKLDLGHLASIVSLKDAGKYIRMLRPGDEFEIQHDHGHVISIYRELGLTSALIISRTDTDFRSAIIERPIELRRRLAYGRIETSLFESAADAGMPDKLIMNLAGIFAWDVDFVLDIRRGDDYFILFEEIYQEGKYITDGEIVAAEFNNNGRTFRAVRYKDNMK